MLIFNLQFTFSSEFLITNNSSKYTNTICKIKCSSLSNGNVDIFSINCYQISECRLDCTITPASIVIIVSKRISRTFITFFYEITTKNVYELRCLRRHIRNSKTYTRINVTGTCFFTSFLISVPFNVFFC